MRISDWSSDVCSSDLALLSDFEDVGPAALRAYAKAGLPDSIVAIRADPQLMHKWTRLKSRALVDFTAELTARVRKIRGPDVKTARNIFAGTILEPEIAAGFAKKLAIGRAHGREKVGP